MTVRLILTAVLALSLSIQSVWAKPSFESLWAEATRGGGCSRQSYSDFILLTCKANLTLWYFTKASHPAHPGVIKRFVTEKNGAFFVSEQGHSFGPDSSQPAFKRWLAEISALNRQLKEELERQQRR